MGLPQAAALQVWLQHSSIPRGHPSDTAPAQLPRAPVLACLRHQLPGLLLQGLHSLQPPSSHIHCCTTGSSTAAQGDGHHLQHMGCKGDSILHPGSQRTAAACLKHLLPFFCTDLVGCRVVLELFLFLLIRKPLLYPRAAE